MFKLPPCKHEYWFPQCPINFWTNPPASISVKTPPGRPIAIIKEQITNHIHYDNLFCAYHSWYSVLEASLTLWCQDSKMLSEEVFFVSCFSLHLIKLINLSLYSWVQTSQHVLLISFHPYHFSRKSEWRFVNEISPYLNPSTSLSYNFAGLRCPCITQNMQSLFSTT